MKPDKSRSKNFAPEGGPLQGAGEPSVEGSTSGPAAPNRLLGNPLRPEEAVASALALTLTIVLGAVLLLDVEILFGITDPGGLYSGAILPIAIIISSVASSFCWSFPNWSPIKLGLLCAGFSGVIGIVITLATTAQNRAWFPPPLQQLAFVGFMLWFGTMLQICATRIRRGTKLWVLKPPAPSI